MQMLNVRMRSQFPPTLAGHKFHFDTIRRLDTFALDPRQLSIITQDMKGSTMRAKLITPCLISLLSTAACFAGDNSLGTWKLNIEKSEYTPPPLPVKSL